MEKGDLWDLLEAFESELHPQVFLMAACGGRWDNLLNMEWIHVAITLRHLEIETRKDKNHKKGCHRVTLRLPLEWIDLRIIETLRPVAGLHEQIATMSTTKFNGKLKAACKQANVDDTSSYVFRRFYIRTMAKRCEDEHGVVDMNKLQTFTNHFSKNTLKSHYLPHASDQYNLNERPGKKRKKE